jgi:hypothetical protein
MSTADTTPALAGASGTTVSDSTTVTVKIYAGSGTTGSPLQTRTATRTANGVWGVDASPLANGVYTARAEQSDAAGNIGASSANTFTVGPRSAGSDPEMVGAGDIAYCEDTGDEATAALLGQFPTATVFTVGDNAYESGTPAEFANCYHPSWGQAKSRTRPTVGDHDYADGSDPTASGYVGYFQSLLTPFGASATDPTRLYYSYDIGSWHVVVLNANCELGGTSSCHDTQVSWLQNDLTVHPAVCTAVMLAAPRFSSGSIHGNNASMQPYWDVFQSRGVELVLSGDEHLYERYAPQNAQGVSDPNGVRQIIIGTGGRSHYAVGPVVQPNSETRNDTAFGVLHLVLRAGSYEWDFVPVAGQSYQDSGSTACH